MRIAATILILTAAAALASPWQMVLARKKANAGGGGACDQLQYEEAGETTVIQVGASTANLYVSSLIEGDQLGNTTICQVDVYLAKYQGATQTVSAHIYSATALEPDTLLATSTTTLDASTLEATYAWIPFEFAGQALTAGTDYCVVLSVNAADAANYVRWYSTGSGYTEHMMESSDGSTWSLENQFRAGNVRLYSQ